MTYENIYGLGFEKATEPGPDVEIQLYSGEWLKRTYNSPLLLDNFTYRRPIKLQVGHRYVRRDGVVVRFLDYEPMNMPGFGFWCSDNKSRHENGAYTTQEQTSLDLVTHIEEPETKEEPMTCLNMNNVIMMNNVPVTYAQIEAAHAEMMKQKAEKEIKLGDIVRHKNCKIMFIVTQTLGYSFGTEQACSYHKDDLEKVTGTPEFMAELRAKLEGK